MDPRRLVIFNRVVTKGSIGAAARELGWTQPAVSQHIAALEKDTGMQLVVRGSGGVTPTEAGARLAVHAAAITQNLEAAETEMNDLAALKKGLKPRLTKTTHSSGRPFSPIPCASFFREITPSLRATTSR